MATVAVDRHHLFNARSTRFQPGPPPPTYIPKSDAPLPPHNDIELNRDMLVSVLEYFSHLVAQLFTGRSIRMVVHGGACMLLHQGLYNISQQQQQMIPSLPRRTTTRDVDYIHRSFVAELASCGMPDAAVKLQECIRSTARHFGLGADWMNSDADIALPMAHDPSGKVYDPIYAASIKQNNIDLHTIFRSTNGVLTLISVTPFWAVSLKLVRYTKWDPGDICLLLRNGMVLSGTDWTPEIVESWLFRNCWPMGYHNFDSGRKAEMRARILHAIELLSKWSSAVKPPEKTISAHDAMGGGDVMGGGEHGGKNGWSYSFGKWPNQVQQLQPQPLAQVSSIQFPMPNPGPAPTPVNVRDWVKNDDPPRSHSPSPRSRNMSTGKSREIFIPPVTDWINPNHAPIPFRPRSRNPTPDPVDDRWHPSESNNNFHAVPRADPYSLESFDRSINSMLHQSHHRNTTLAIPSGSQPVIPMNILRKERKKRRKQDRKRERQSKWRSSGHRDSDTSDSSDDDEPAWHPPPTTTQQPPQLRIGPPPPMHPQNRSQDASNHHPTHLNLTSPGPPPVSAPPQMSIPVANNHMHIGLHSPPQSFGPAQLAQYQFEQQHSLYEFEKHQQHQHQQQQYHYQQRQRHQPQTWNNGGVTVYR